MENKMENKETMVNFGIDLGTTNSVICKFEKGEVVTFKNPVGWSETLPCAMPERSDQRQNERSNRWERK